MNSTFKLKEPNTDSKTLILFRTYFKKEGKSFIYSTGEKINPKNWNSINHQPKLKRNNSTEANELRGIDQQLIRYTLFFRTIYNRYKLSGEELTREILKQRFNEEFKKSGKKNAFFYIYDKFLDERENDCTGNAITKSTLKRYIYNKTLLQSFQNDCNINLTFGNFDEQVYNKLVKYCIEEKGHSNNTVNRNVGLLKTFFIWALKKKYTYNNSFQEFKKPPKFTTEEIALNWEQVQHIYNFDLSAKKSLERVRDLFVFGCTTGLRYGNYSTIKKEDIQDDIIKVIDQKSKSKSLSVPLNSISKEILEKYEYNLPTISNQKMNKYIKEVFKIAGYNQVIVKSMKYGSEVIEIKAPLYERISSHTARRTFITIMKNKRVPDKVIMSYTGHKSLEVFNNYYKPSDEDRIDYMNEIFK